MWETIILILAVVLMVAGVLGAVLPLLPSAPLVLLGAFVFALATDFEKVTWTVLAWLLALTVVSQLLDYLATVYGAKRMRASKWGMAGALCGTLVGAFAGGVAGLVIGPFLGAFVFEMVMAGRNPRDSLRSGFGAFLGFVGGALGKLLIALVMCAVFIWCLV